MRNITSALAVVVALSWGCDKDAPPEDNTTVAKPGADKDTAVAKPGADKDKAADKGTAGDKAAARKVPGSENKAPATKEPAKPTAGSVPGLKQYTSKQDKFSVMTATINPKTSPVEAKEPGVTVKGQTYLFPFKNPDSGIGGVTVANVTAKQYDLDAGLDGAINKAVGAMSGALTKLERNKDNGRPARQFEYKGSRQGMSFNGVGVGIGVGPRRIVVAFTLYPVGSAAGEAEAREFVKTFKAE